MSEFTPVPHKSLKKIPTYVIVYQWKYIIYVKPSNQENQLLTYISDNFKYNSDYTRSYSDHKKCTFCKTWIPCFHQIYLGILQTSYVDISKNYIWFGIKFVIHNLLTIY